MTNPPIAEWLDELRERAETDMIALYREGYDGMFGIGVKTNWDVSAGYEICIQDLPDGNIRCIKLINWVDGTIAARVKKWNHDHAEAERSALITRPEDV